MAGQGTGRGGLSGTMAEFVRARQRDLEHFSHEAEAVAREAYRRSIRDGEDLILKTSSDVMKYGAGLLGAQKRPVQAKAVATVPTPVRKVASAAPVRAPAEARTGSPPSPQWWDSNPVLRGVGAIDALALGIGAGVLQGGRHSVEGLANGMVFLNRLADPVDWMRSPPGQSAQEQFVDVGRGAVDYVRKGIADPWRVVDDVKAKAHQMRIDLDPTATPAAATLAGELGRNFNIGMNQGELGFDVGSVLYGGPLAKTAKEFGLLSKSASFDKSIAQKFLPAAAEYLSEPYVGMKHHSVFPRRAKLPAILGGGPMPKWVSESEFNLLGPPGMSRGEFYIRHYLVDPKFHGTGIPKRLNAGNWSGKKLGLKKYGDLRRIWYGTPTPLKARVGGLGAAAGSVMYADPSEEE